VCVYYPLQVIYIHRAVFVTEGSVTSMTKRALTKYIEDTCDQHSPNDYHVTIHLSSMWSHVVSMLLCIILTSNGRNRPTDAEMTLFVPHE